MQIDTAFNTAWQIGSDRAFILFLGGDVTLEKQQFCWQIADVLGDEPIKSELGLAELVVGMNAVTAYLATVCNAHRFYEILDKLNAFTKDFIQQYSHHQGNAKQGRHVEIPVIYGGEYGVDLADCAARLDMSIDELVAAHTTPVYTVYFIGFQAGFPYLGGLPKQLHLPRHAKPRLAVPAGSVGIGGSQTGVYPFSSPGGWQLLGQTQTQFFDKHKTPPTLLQAGDTLSFVAIDIIS